MVTFAYHPRSVLYPELKLGRLTTIEERSRLLRDLGVNLILPIAFTAEIAAMPAREFVIALIRYLRMEGLVVGPNFALGKNREGDVRMLERLGRELGFSVEVVEPLKMHETLISSTAIRSALAAGDLKAANRLLGRYFTLAGQVVGGRERGQELGYPTANIAVDAEQALPADGVYATLIHVANEIYPSATNIGRRPTFDDGEHTIEAFIMGFGGNIYGQKVTLQLVERLREERKFPTVDDLVTQLGRDVAEAKEILKEALVGVRRSGSKT